MEKDLFISNTVGRTDSMASTAYTGSRAFKQLRGPKVKWIETYNGREAQWDVPVDRLIVLGAAKNALRRSDFAKIMFLGQGSFNSIYSVQYQDARGPNEVIMKVMLPINPQWKTESEVATMGWIRKHTSVPVPATLAFEMEAKEAPYFEWIMMEKMPGTKLQDAWDRMDVFQRRGLVSEIAKLNADLYKHNMKYIGSLSEITEGTVHTRPRHHALVRRFSTYKQWRAGDNKFRVMP